MFDLTKRNNLIDLREAAEQMIVDGTSPSWKRAYEDLAAAADRLDAMKARCELRVEADVLTFD